MCTLPSNDNDCRQLDTVNVVPRKNRLVTLPVYETPRRDGGVEKTVNYHRRLPPITNPRRDYGGEKNTAVARPLLSSFNVKPTTNNKSGV